MACQKSKRLSPHSVSESVVVSGAMDARSNAHTGTMHVTMQEILAIDEMTARATEKLEAEFSREESKIHRFPRGLQGIGGDDRCHIVPSVVAIGPYHHGAPHLQKMEEVKLAAAYYFCRGCNRSTMDVYEKVLSVVGAARGCYDADDPSVAGVSDSDFAAMMFLDGCFLLQYMAVGDTAPVLQTRMTRSTGPSIQKDIFVLENQLPWLVVEALREFMPVDMHGFVEGMGEKFWPGEPKAKGRWQVHCGCIPVPGESGGGRGSNIGGYRPPHLLGLLRFILVGSMPPDKVSYKRYASTSSSAVELAEIGFKLAPSTAPWFGDMRVRRLLLFGELSLSPVFLNDVTSCWLVNIAALEASTPVGAWKDSDGYIVSSYLSMLAMLMDREEDVHELRRRRLLYSALSNKQALRFFKGLARHLRFGDRYFSTLEAIHSYRRRRPVRTAAHKFVYNNYKVIAAVLSITGVLAGIFKTLLSLKQHY